MRGFLREYWPWILVPVLLAAGLVLLAWFLGGEETSPFDYRF